MSKQEHNEENHEDSILYVYLPYEDIHGVVVKHGLYYSVVEYFDNGVGYHIEVDNEDFIIVDEFGIGYTDETEEDL